MRNIRNCSSGLLYTGTSKCPINFGKIKGALVLEHGSKLPAKLTGEALEQLCHADKARVCPILNFVEYGKEGGEPQKSSVGYGDPAITGLNQRTDTFTLAHFDANLNASLLETVNAKYDVYYFDDDNVIYGMNDGSDSIAGFPMSTIYPTSTPHPTSSEIEKMTVSFCHKDARESLIRYDYIQADFIIEDYAIGLNEIELVEITSNKFKVVEKHGGLDRTAEFGNLIETGASSILTGATTATYDAETDLISITPSEEKAPGMKAPSVLYSAEIKGIVYVGTKSIGK